MFKGPYTCDDPRLIKNLRFTYAIQLLEKALELPEWQRGIIAMAIHRDWEAMINIIWWLQMLANGKIFPLNWMSSKIETNVPIVPRGGFVWRVSDVEKNGQLTDEIKLAALQHLYLRFILDIGDSGTHNILIREDYDSTGRLIAGIDLEDRRGNIANSSRLNLLFSKLYKKHISLYISDVHKIKSLSYRQLGQHTLDKLSAVDIDLKRLKVNMARW